MNRSRGPAQEAEGPDSVVFEELEAFLTEHGFHDAASAKTVSAEVYDEEEIAESVGSNLEGEENRDFKAAESQKVQTGQYREEAIHTGS